MSLIDWFRRKHAEHEARLDEETAVKVGATPLHIRKQEDDRLAQIRAKLKEIAE